MTEKAYCCGNSAQREATLISKFDLIVSAIFFCMFTTFLSILASDPDKFQEIANRSPQNVTTDLDAFLQWPRGGQLGVLSCLIILHFVYIGLAIFLLIAAIKRHHKWLLIWFASTLFSYTLGFILVIITVVYLHDKIAISIGLVTVFLYKWYSVWIVKILMREITSVSEGDSYGDPIEGQEGSEMPMVHRGHGSQDIPLENIEKF